MLIEDYMNSLEIPYLALEILNNILYNEVCENYGKIKRGDEEKILNKILAISCANTTLIKRVQDEREEIRKTVNDR